MEVLIAMFLFAVATIAIVGVSVLVSKTTFKVEKQVVAQAIANDTIEKLHGLPYSKVGEVPSGATLQDNPVVTAKGGIEYKQVIQQDQQEYVVITDVVPIDDPANGAVTGTISLTNADYKSVRVEVNPTLGGVASGSASSSSVVSAATTVSNWPPGACLPGEVNACLVAFSALPSTFTFVNEVQMRTFVNSLGLYVKSPDASDATSGRMYNDAATRTKICDLKGYAAVQSYTSGASSPPANYTNTKWETAQNNFQNYAGNQPTNSHLVTLVCSSPKSTAACSYAVACPASGNCADAVVPRGYTPSGALYPGEGDPAWVCS